MPKELWWTIFISEIISIVLVFLIIRSDREWKHKILLAIIASIPIIGPVFFGICTTNPPIRSHLENRGARGDYTHSWISTQSSMKEIIKTLEEIEKEKKDD